MAYFHKTYFKTYQYQNNSLRIQTTLRTPHMSACRCASTYYAMLRECRAYMVLCYHTNLFMCQWVLNLLWGFFLTNYTGRLHSHRPRCSIPKPLTSQPMAAVRTHVDVRMELESGNVRMRETCVNISTFADICQVFSEWR